VNGMIKTISFVFMILWSFSASLKAQLKSDYCISLAFSLMDIKQNELADSLFDKAFLIALYQNRYNSRTA
jgi:hypothetical protein